jgi:hypothetical protein
MDRWSMKEDWRRAELLVIAYPSDHLGWYPAERFALETVPSPA